MFLLKLTKLVLKLNIIFWKPSLSQVLWEILFFVIPIYIYIYLYIYIYYLQMSEDWSWYRRSCLTNEVPYGVGAIWRFFFTLYPPPPKKKKHISYRKKLIIVLCYWFMVTNVKQLTSNYTFIATKSFVSEDILLEVSFHVI